MSGVRARWWRYRYAAATLEERLAPCLACHGEQGQSGNPEVPSLGAQPAFYVTIQLYMFRERMRVVEPMNETTKGLERRWMCAAWRSSSRSCRHRCLRRTRQIPPGIERARLLIQQHRCNFCHNQDFSGAQNVPRLAGQREDYLVKALREYKSNARRGYEPQMADVVTLLSDADFADLAAFLARAK